MTNFYSITDRRVPTNGDLWQRSTTALVVLMAILFTSPIGAQDDDEAGDAEQKLPKLEDMQLPSAEDLLLKHPVDWIVLKNDQVLRTKPVQPRPNTVTVMQQRIEESLSWPVPRPSRRKNEGDAAFRDRSRRLVDDYRKRRDALKYLTIKLPNDIDLAEEQEASEFRLHVEDNVKEVIHHEDLMLRRIDQLLTDGDLRKSFELLLVLKRRAHDWPGADERHNRHLFLSATAKLKNKEPYDAWLKLSSLYLRNPKYPQIHTKAGEVAGQLISDSVEQKDFRRARHFLGQLKATIPDHPVATDWQNRLITQTNDLLNQSVAATKESRHSDAIELATRASRIWPLAPNVRRVYTDASNRFQVLSVGTVYPDGMPLSTGFPTEHILRYRHLTQIDLFEVHRADDDSAHYKSRLFEEWTPTDLGRQAVFQLYRNRHSWESNPAITSTRIAECLQARIDPNSDQYDGRVAGFIDSISTRSPYELEIAFANVPIRTEPLFRFPVMVREESDQKKTMDAWQMLTRRFQLVDSSPQARMFERTVPQVDNLTQYQAAKVVERKYHSHEKAIQGLLRGEVSMLARIPAWTVERFEKDERFILRNYALPTTHVLQFHPRSKMMKSRELRRALAYSIKPDSILKEVMLRNTAEQRGRLVSAPFSTRSYAYNQHVPVRQHDFRLAIALAMVARKDFNKKLPKLRMICEPDPIVHAAATRLVKQWKRIGVEVSLVGKDEDNADADPPWDIAYRTTRMAEPVFELWPFLTLEQTPSVSSLSHLPDWLRHQLIALEQSADWGSVVNHLNRLHLQLHESAQLIPLWEIDDVFIVRKNIQGVPQTCIHPYQDIERWIIHPWYPTATK